MDAAREDRMERLFEEASTLAPAERSAFLEDACDGDPELRSELEELLIHAHAARDFVDRVAGRIVARCAINMLDDSEMRPREKAKTITQRLLRPTRRLVHFSVAAVVSVLAVTAGSLLARSRSRARADGSSVRSVAVLPVTDFTPDTARRLLADEMADLLTEQLSHVSGLRVMGRASMIGYRGTQEPVREIGRELGVDGLVEGTVLREGERVRVNVSLIAADAERALWSRSFEGSMLDVRTLQREAAEAVAREIQRRLTR